MDKFKNLYRGILYRECRILANDLDDIFKEIKLFVDKKVSPYLNSNENCDRLIFDGIELVKEEDKCSWSIYSKNDLSNQISTEITLDDINLIFKGNTEFLKHIKDDHGIINFPKELYGKAFMILAMTVTELLNKSELHEEMNLFDIFTISNNGNNNIIY